MSTRNRRANWCESPKIKSSFPLFVSSLAASEQSDRKAT